MDKRLVIEEEVADKQTTETASELEHAYFANSYPIESKTVSTTVTCIKLVSAMTILFELWMVARLVGSYMTYHSKLAAINQNFGVDAKNLVPDTVKIAAFIYMGNCLMKFVAAITNYHHAGVRTERTIENVNGHNSFTLKVTAVSLLISVIVLFCLNTHQTSNLDNTRLCEIIESLKGSVYAQLAL